MAVTAITDQQLGKFLQIAFSDGVRNQISQDFRDWEFVKRARVADPDGRELRFLFQSNLGPGAIQYRAVGSAGSFPAAQQSSIAEYSAVYKELNATIQLEYNLWDRARKSPSKYADILANEILSKTIAAKRRLAADLYNDGLGCLGVVASVVDTTGAGGSTVVTLNVTDSANGHSHPGFFEYGDLLVAKQSGGSARSATVTGTFYAWRVKSRSRANNTVTIEAVDSSYTVLSLTASNLVAGDYLARVGQSTFANLASVTDYGTETESMAGLESLAASDGRVIHGITMSGANAGTTEDAGGSPIDVSNIEGLMNNVKINVGEGRYNWKMAVMAPEVYSSFIEGRETDRRFVSMADEKRGSKGFGYIHRNDVLEFYTSEYCPKKRLYVLPENKNGEKVIEFYGSDFEPVTMGSQMGEFHLRPSSSGGHERNIVSYLQAMAVLIAKHPAAIGRVHNFTF